MGNRSFMRRTGSRLAVLLLTGTVFGSFVHAAPQDWPPVTDAERALKDCPAQPGAPAVFLSKVQISNDNDWTYKIFHRLKILTPAGKEYGTVEVPFSDVWQVEEIKARVVRPDGQVRPFTGEVFEKTLLQIGRLRRLVKTFALPDIDVGSIIDYRYEIKLDLKKAVSARSLRLERWKPEEGGVPRDSPRLAYTAELWDFDSPLYTYKAKYIYVPYNKGRIAGGGRSLRLAFVTQGLVWGPPTMNAGQVELEVENIPAREKDEWMAPEEEGHMGVTFFLCDSSVVDPADYWRLEGQNWRNTVDVFMETNDGIAEEGRALIAGAPSPLDKLKALYERAQRIENLSYVRDLSPARKKELKIKDNRSVADVLKRNAGLRSDITRTFAALARAAGFSADVARVVSRDDKFFNENILDLYGQFDTEVAIVKVDGREMFFDPATPFCPMGLVPWSCTDTTFIRTSGPPGKFYTMPLDAPQRSGIHREFALQLDGEGGLGGMASLTYTGQEALGLRLECLGADEAWIRKSLEEKMSALLPEGAKASLRNTGNMASSEDGLRVEYEIAIPRVATTAGDRTLLPAVPFRTRWRDSFRHARRKSSVYLPYPVSESDDVVVTLPDSMAVETAPAACLNERPFARHSLATTVEEGTRLRVRRELTIMKYRFPGYQYPALKSFFDQVRSGDDAQIVLGPKTKKPPAD